MMCFNYDYEWYADISDQETLATTRPTQCVECGKTIDAGNQMVFISQQEYEECHTCDMGDCECAEDECCQCDEPDFGNHYEGQWCMNCEKLLSAIEATELGEGCNRSEARPPFEQLFEELANLGGLNSKKYWDKAEVMFPELVANGYLDSVWDTLFGE